MDLRVTRAPIHNKRNTSPFWEAYPSCSTDRLRQLLRGRRNVIHHNYDKERKLWLAVQHWNIPRNELTDRSRVNETNVSYPFFLIFESKFSLWFTTIISVVGKFWFESPLLRFLDFGGFVTFRLGGIFNLLYYTSRSPLCYPRRAICRRIFRHPCHLSKQTVKLYFDLIG